VKTGRSHAASRGLGSGLLIAATVVTAIAVVGAGTFLFINSDSDPECDSKPLVLAASEQFETIAQAAAKAVNGDCAKVRVKVQSAAEVLDTPAESLPDLWISDSPAALHQLEARSVYLKTVSPAIASSPVLLAGGPTAKPVSSWKDALTPGDVTMLNPLVDGPSALALTSAAAENPSISEKDMGNTFLLSAQRYGEASAGGQVQAPKLEEISATTVRLLPTDEHDLLTAIKTNSNITPVVPQTGPLLLEFPLVAFTSKLESYTVGEQVAKWLRSAAGTKVLNANQFRNQNGRPIPGTTLVEAEPLPQVPEETEGTAMRFWSVTSVPSSLLAVLDVSGSMKFKIGNTTRLAIEMDAAKAALQVFPDHARIGAWVFSENQGPNGRPWKELAPLKRLDARDGNLSHRKSMQQVVDTLPGMTRGGTGLYTTTLAGYKRVLASYNDKYFNSLILMTDGANEEPNSISLNKLLSELKDLRDPDRSVRIIAIGISADADMKSLRKIAAATGGQAYRADTPDEIIQVFQDALLSR
jgi:hypothetical protein